MSEPLTDALGFCKTIMRNGFDAYVVSLAQQRHLLEHDDEAEVDIATDIDIENLQKLYPEVDLVEASGSVAMLRYEDALYRFYLIENFESSHPEVSLARSTPRLMERLQESHSLPMALACPYFPQTASEYDQLMVFEDGRITLAGIPDETLKRNYLMGIKVLRHAANENREIEPNTWMAILRAARRILDYAPVGDVMDEWRKVEAENLWKFVRMLFDAQILHGLIPEVAALSRLEQVKNDSGEVINILDLTIESIRRYPEELPYDWYGAMACLFMNVGKLYVAEFSGDRWWFHHHHVIGAKVTRKVLGRLSFSPDDVDLICHLVRHHVRFQFMLNDRGIRRFTALDEYPRLIEMARADIKARDDKYTSFNHNMKYLERGHTPEEMLEPLLNGNEIMDFTGVKPGPMVGLMRKALLKAQIAGEVTTIPDAVEFLQRLKEKEGLD
jgi:poly(A) polymerase